MVRYESLSDVTGDTSLDTFGACLKLYIWS